MQFASESFGGFSECAVFRHDALKLIITTQIGPRILYFGYEDGPNHLLARPEHQGLLGGEYRSYGGHRLWRGPENRALTYSSDSFPVTVVQEADSILFRSVVDEYGVQREISIQTCLGGFAIGHRLLNHGPEPLYLTPWAITVMAAGGECVVPMHQLRPQSEGLLPVQSIALWGYTSMADARFAWGQQVARLRSTDDPNPTKFGAYVEQGVAAYSNFGETFVKRFDVQPSDSHHIDMGCNFESYTKAGMLEVESLGIQESVAPGSATQTHTETWHLVKETIPTDDVAAGEFLRKFCD